MVVEKLSGQIIDTTSVVYSNIDHVFDSEGIYLTADKMPEFNEGNEEVYSFVQENMGRTYLNREEKSRSFISFIIDKNGCVKDVQVVKGKDERLNRSIVRVVERMPSWKPGEIAGEKVEVRLTFPFKY